MAKDKYEDCKKVLAGEVGRLGNAFLWSRTPQGHKHWLARYRGEVPLSEDDRAYIRGLMDGYERENGIKTESPATVPMPVPAPTTINPPHYTFGKFEVIEVLEDWFAADPLLWQVGKYISRAGRKGEMLEDLKKAQWYLERKIASVSTAKVLDHYAEAIAAVRREDVTADATGFKRGDRVVHVIHPHLGRGTVTSDSDKEGWTRATFPGYGMPSDPWLTHNLLRAEEQISPAEEVDRIRGKK